MYFAFRTRASRIQSGVESGATRIELKFRLSRTESTRMSSGDAETMGKAGDIETERLDRVHRIRRSRVDRELPVVSVESIFRIRFQMHCSHG